MEDEELNKKKKEKNRDIGLDIIRVIAVLLVISTHFFLYSGFYSVKLVGNDKIIMGILLVVSMTCVPLFLLLTGYLNNKKELSKKYYLRIVPILSVYILVSLVEILYKFYFNNMKYNLFSIIKYILNFQTQYSWYVEMYIGLFMMIPFLNIVWNNLKNKKERKILVLTMLSLTVLPTIINNFNINLSYGIKQIILATNQKDKIIPAWWVSIYPIMYYFIGCYICEYKEDIKLKSRYSIYVLLIFSIIFGCWNHFRCNGGVWRHEDFAAKWYGYENVICSILLFISILRINFRDMPSLFKKVINKLSKVSFGIYLISYIFDSFFYKILNENVSEVANRWIYYPIMVISVFVCSSITSILLYWIKDSLIKIIKKIMIPENKKEKNQLKF